MTTLPRRAQTISLLVTTIVAVALAVVAIHQQLAGDPAQTPALPKVTETSALVVTRSAKDASTICGDILDVDSNDPLCRRLDASSRNGILRFTIPLRAPEAARQPSGDSAP